MKQKLFILTFNYIKQGYAEMPYSVASIIASLKGNPQIKDLEIEHKNLDLGVSHEKFSHDKEKIEKEVFRQAKKIVLEKCWDANYLAIGVAAWNDIYVKKLLPFLQNNFKGKLIAGGYEITAINEQTLPIEFPGFGYYIKGYAETALANIILDKYPVKENGFVINEKLNPDNLQSVYLDLTLPVKNKIYWETKRGCSHRCGFCEWGNADQRSVYQLPLDRLHKEIRVFQSTGVDAINVLDGTFNSSKKEGKIYVGLFERLLDETNATLNIQTRFEDIKEKNSGAEFLKLCEKYSNRITLEFGIQTINEKEMEIIGRKNDIPKIRSIMKQLNNRGINYETSIIYGIPGQTTESMLKTIEFIIKNGCEKIHAYPLRIPRNSQMEKDKERLGVKEELNIFNVLSTSESYSFTPEDYKVMNHFSSSLKLMAKTKSLLDFEFELSFLILEYSTEGSFKLVEMSKDNKLSFNAPNEKIKELLSGYEEIILKLLSTKESKWVFENVFETLSSKKHWAPRIFSKLLKVVMENAIWHYAADNGNKYLCSVRISKSGNIFVFKDCLDIGRRLKGVEYLEAK